MLIRRSALLASLLAFVFASSACTTTSQGSPAPGASTSPSVSGTSTSEKEQLPFAGAPKVDDPLDTSRYEKDPCKSLSSAQAEDLNLPPAGKITEDEVLGTGCDWFNEESRGEVEIVFIVDDPRGLSPEYEANKRGDWAYFLELPDIEGYPAVARSRTDDRDNGRCTVVVGVADDMAFETVLRLSEANVGHREPCDVAAEVAGKALQTMKEGA